LDGFLCQLCTKACSKVGELLVFEVILAHVTTVTVM
jgi:hypothetical protein